MKFLKQYNSIYDLQKQKLYCKVNNLTWSRKIGRYKSKIIYYIYERKSSNSEKNFVDAGQQHLFEPVEEKKGQEWQHEVNMYLFLLKM